jgi:hypothetical protein
VGVHAHEWARARALSAQVCMRRERDKIFLLTLWKLWTTPSIGGLDCVQPVYRAFDFFFERTASVSASGGLGYGVFSERSFSVSLAERFLLSIWRREGSPPFFCWPLC